MDFHQTVRGAKFFDRDIPSLIKQLSRIADSLEKKPEPTTPAKERMACRRFSFEEYKSLLSRLFPDDGIIVHCALDGLWYKSLSGNDFTDEDFFEPLAEQLGISRIISIHADDAEPVNVWVVYREVD